MATQPTNQPVPSESPRDLKFNAGKIDEFVTSSGLKYTDRFGGEHYTIEGLRWLAQQTMAAFGYITIDSFEDGAILTLPNEVLRLEATGEYYRWGGAFPVSGKVVPPGSTPTSTGGIGVGAWLSVGDATLRGQLYSSSLPGTSLIKHSDGKTVQQELNSILSVHSRVFSVDDPQFAGGAKGDSNGTVGNGTDDTAAIYACFQAAIAAGGGKIVFSPGKTYRTTYTTLYGSNLVVDGQGACLFHDSNTTNGSALQPATFQSYAAFTERVIFMNLVVSGPVGRGNGIGANRARHITLFNVGSKYLHWHLWDGAGCQYWKVINCWSEGTNSAAFQIDVASYPNASEASDSAGNILPISYDAAGTAGWSYGYDCLIDGCTVRNSAYCGISIHNTGNRNIRIVNNYIEDSDSGILADDSTSHVTINTQISNNTFIRCRIPISWKGGYDRLSIVNNNIYGGNTTDWYYGIYILPYSQTQTTLKLDGNFFNGIIRPVIVNGANGFSFNANIFHTCGGTTAPASGGVVSQENPLSILRASGCQSGTISDNVFQSCLAPVCISVARNEVDSTYSIAVKLVGNISRGSGCLYSIYYGDRCSISSSEYVGLTTDYYALYAAICPGLVVDNYYVSQGTGRGLYFDNCARLVLRDSVLLSSGTDLAVVINNSATVKTSSNIITGGYGATHINLTGNTTAICDEAFATIGKSGTASGTKVTYTTTAI
ncbi:hypothetical protein QVK98_002353 [Escherichia coli]|uniref:tail fiber/spike domain-containing protein n=1 Tax=Escherichia coli TaxID=562 RepID=UPI00292C63E8|nr:hypothetical protein [Escherichia coli]